MGFCACVWFRFRPVEFGPRRTMLQFLQLILVSIRTFIRFESRFGEGQKVDAVG